MLRPVKVAYSLGSLGLHLRALALVCIIGPLLFLGACTASPGSESAGEFIDSSTITAKIKADLLDELGTKAIGIQVKTFKDDVQLSGFVHSTYLKQRASTIAIGHVGSQHVQNDLIISRS